MLRQTCCAILLLGFAGTLCAQKTAINCVVVMQYTPDMTGPRIASNKELWDSAQLLMSTTFKGEDTEIAKVTGTEEGNPSPSLEAALDAFTKGKKRCCKKIVILSHGADDGSLDMPYDLPKSDEIPERDRSAMVRQLGGPTAKTGWGRDRLAEFVKAVKTVSCDQKPTVTFDGCYTGKDGGIAEQVAAQGVGTTGITGWCEFGMKDQDTGKMIPLTPRPEAGGTSTAKPFDPKSETGTSGSGGKKATKPPESPKAPPLPPVGGNEGVSLPTPVAPLLASTSFTPIQPRPGNGTGNDQGSYLPPLAGPGSTITGSVVDENEAGPRGFIVGTVDDTGKRSFFSGITDAGGHLAFVVPSGVTAVELFRHFDKNGNPSAPAHTAVGQPSHLEGTDPLPPDKIPTDGPAITEANSAIERGGPTHGTTTMHTRGTDPLRTRVLIDDKPSETYAASDTSVVAHLPEELPLGTHQFSLSSAGRKTNSFPADVVAVHPEPIAPLHTGATTTVRVHVEGVPKDHQAAMHFEVSGAARLVGGKPSVDVPVSNGVATVQIQAVHPGQLVAKYQLRVSIPNYWAAPMQ